MKYRIHWPRFVAAVVLCGSLFGVAATSAFAQPSPASVPASTVSGEPSTNDGSPVGYYLWHNANGFHLRTHGPGAEHDFVAHLYTRGTFKGVDRSMLEPRDSVNVSKNGHELVAHFHTFDGWDGVSFHIAGGEYLQLNLRLDGQEISTDNIFIGPSGAHPPTNPFRIEI